MIVRPTIDDDRGGVSPQPVGPQDRRERVHEVCAAIPRGRWTSYGDVADLAGLPGAARLVARIAAAGVPNAHRVMRASGRVADGFRTADGGGPEVARAMLRAEGVGFSRSGVADPARRWTGP